METPIADLIGVSTSRSHYGSTTTSTTARDGESLNETSDQDDERSTTATLTTRTQNDSSDCGGYQNLTESNSGLSLYSDREDQSRISSSANNHSRYPLRKDRLTRIRMDMKSSLRLEHHENDRSLMRNIEIFLNVVNHMFIGFVTISLSYLTLRKGLAGTGLHAWLVTIGFSFLMAEAIMCHYANNVLTFNYKRTTKTTIHWILQTLGGSLGVIGILVKFYQKGFRLQSTHSKLGFAALVLCLVSMLSGLGALYSIRLRKLLNPVLNKTVHNTLGLATLAVALLAQFYGYQTNYFIGLVAIDFRKLLQAITLLSLCLTCVGPLRSLCQKMRSIIKIFS